MPLCQLFVDKKQHKFMLIKMPDQVTPDDYQSWVNEEERENNIQAFSLSQQMLDKIALEYMDNKSYEAKYVLMKAPDEKQIFVSSLELGIDGDEKIDIVRSGLLIILDEEEIKHFTTVLQNVWNEGEM
ncbi:MAG: hypothetical protein ACI4T3_07080 [Lactobacillus sp.]